jgi:hypothetical protein
MQCTFCGTENRPEYKFCGMCGVKLERRQTERRARQGGVDVKCASCGHLSEPGLKFCGMCGTRVERRMQERRGSGNENGRAVAIANAQLPTPEARKAVRPERASPVAATLDTPTVDIRRGEPAIFHNEPRQNEPLRSEPRRDDLRRDDLRRNEPVREQPISGPSFLGLNAQPEGGEDGGYLLEDEPSRGGLRKVLLLVIIVAILGLIFMQWRSGFKASPKASPSKAEPASSPAGENRSPAPPTTEPSAKDPVASQAKDPVASANANDGPSAAKDPAGDPKGQAENPIAAVVPSAAAAPASSPAEAPNENVSADGGAHAAADGKAPGESHLSDTKPSQSLLRAQQFLQGRGVAQNCEQGLLYLKAATDKGDPGAAVQMAALYSSGHCVKQDRVMAYRWFNSAHELEPANMWIQKNMDQIWAQMSPQERRLAGY